MITSSSSEPLSSLSDLGATSYLQMKHTISFFLTFYSNAKMLHYRTAILCTIRSINTLRHYFNLVCFKEIFYLKKHALKYLKSALGVYVESKLPFYWHTCMLTQGSFPARPPAGLLWEHPHQLESCHCPHEWLSLGGHSSDWSHPEAITQASISCHEKERHQWGLKTAH